MKQDNSGYSLDVYIGSTAKIATMTLSSGSEFDITFRYEPHWLKVGFPLSPHLPFNEDISPRSVRYFLQNLLPEGKGLDELLSSTTVSKNNTFGLIRLMGEETAGALSFRVAGQSEATTEFRVVTEQELSDKLSANLAVGIPLTYWDGRTRLSVAGVQEKLNFLEIDQQIGFGEGRLCSNKIFKFETGRVPCIAVNELFTMLLAGNAGLSVPPVALRTYANVRTLVIQRFDRIYMNLPESEPAVMRRHVIDGCQATNLPPSFKYERQFGDTGDGIYLRDGVSFEKLFAVKMVNPANYEMQLIRWLTFNLLVGNYDAHGKNISFFVDKEGLALAPFYDLVSVEASIREIHRQQAPVGSVRARLSANLLQTHEYSRHFAMSVGDYESGSAGNFDAPITAYALASFADDFGISLARMQLMMKQMILATLRVVSVTREQVLVNDLKAHEVAHVDLCVDVVRENSTELLEQVEQIVEMKPLL